jgi:hypothetical protein
MSCKLVSKKRLSIILVLNFVLFSANLSGAIAADGENEQSSFLRKEQTEVSASDSEESPEAFLERYYRSASKAQSVDELNRFYTSSTRTKLPGMNDPLKFKMFMTLFAGIPSSVKIASRKNSPDGKIRFELIPKEIPSQFANMAKEKEFSMKGYATLCKSGKSWEVEKDYWIVESKGANSKRRLAFGQDPLDEHKAEHGSNASSLIAGSASGSSDNYQARVRDSLRAKLTSTSSEEIDVNACFKVAPDGTIQLLAVKDKAGRKSAEQLVTNLFQKVQKIEPLPVNLQAKSFAWMAFIARKGDAGIAISGPYFDKSIPKWLSYQLGLEQRPYDLIVIDKIMKTLDAKKTGSGKAKVYLKLGQNGVIQKIFVRTAPKDAAAEKIAYDVVSRSHPFGAFPDKYSKAPYFELFLGWSPDGNCSGFNHLAKPPDWLK